MKRLISLTVLIIAVSSAAAFAQFEVGASYELRDENPKSGFGLRVQKGLLEKLPMVDLGLRAHFSYFHKDNKVNDEGATIAHEITNYDFGVAAIGGVSLGLLQPFVGVGLGSETIDLEDPDLDSDKRNDSNIYWNLSAGAKATIVPMVKPFVEYRYTNKELSEPRLSDTQNGRIIFGVLISF